jgi:hypothetical protein
MDTNRRSALALMGGGVAAGLVAGPAIWSCAPGPDASGTTTGHAVPFPYVKLDPERIGEAGYQNFYVGDCMYGVFATIIEALAEEVGEPFSSFPKDVARYGAGGVMGWGTLCGAANGAAMAIYMVSSDPARAINEVFGFYEQEALPNFVPSQPRFQVPQSVSESTLCHVSISRWSDASGFKSFSPERVDRCAQLVGSLAKYTVEVLNAQVDGNFEARHAFPESVLACQGCHMQGSVLENSRGNMNCGSCHGGPPEEHP